MSISNPERVATKQDLKDFYDVIFPYLGGKVEAGFTPIGTIIAVMGNSAPTNYLACNGQIVNIADYPELANYFNAQFGSYNKFGGDGTTTFGIPDLRGEFLRGTGTNSHSNQGNGADVGTHQDATEVPYTLIKGSSKQLLYRGDTQTNIQLVNSDKTYKRGTGTTTLQYVSGTTDSASPGNVDAYSVRPTNTSVLFCIAVKNIYMGGGGSSTNYSTDEQMIGTWIDGKPLYQKVIPYDSTITISSTRAEPYIADITDLDIETCVYCQATFKWGLTNFKTTPFIHEVGGGDIIVTVDTVSDGNTFQVQLIGKRPSGSTDITNLKTIIQYTKTTD